MAVLSRHKDGFTISTDKQFLDEDVVFSFLSQESYWAQDTGRENVRKSIENTALCFGIYEGDPERGTAQFIGFARIITDLATIAYLADVFVVKEYRGRGLFKWLMSIIVSHPDLQGLRRFLLVTKDAQALYGQFGFRPLGDDTDYFLQISNLKLE
jgi:GNAT superfamily N-acetyltransferase